MALLYKSSHCQGDIEYDQSTKTTNIFVTAASDTPEIIELKNQLTVISKEVYADAHPLKPLIEQIVFFFNPVKVFMLKMTGVTGTDVEMYIELVVIIPNDNKTPNIWLIVINQRTSG